ncbi:hypothetical protein GOQ04_01320 [Emticicia sp. ODNR4P]|nr:hypothetical protein [Emticicia sp. ODNR4P]
MIFRRDAMIASNGKGIVKAEVVEAQSGRGTKAQSGFSRDVMLAPSGRGVVKAEVPSCLCHLKKTLCASVPLPLQKNTLPLCAFVPLPLP